MKGKRAVAMAVSISVALATSAAWAISEHASAKEAEAMVKKGVAYIKTNGKDKGYAEITSKQSQFRDRDLYLVVYGLDGKVWAHGANEKMVGKMLIEPCMHVGIVGKPTDLPLHQLFGLILHRMRIAQPGNQPGECRHGSSTSPTRATGC